MNNVLDPYSSTVLAGPGYYFKYSPATMQTDDTSVVTTTFTTGVQSAVFLFFSNTFAATDITPTIYIFEDSTSTNTVTTVTIKKINFLGSNQAYQVSLNGVVTTTVSISTDS